MERKPPSRFSGIFQKGRIGLLSDLAFMCLLGVLIAAYYTLSRRVEGSDEGLMAGNILFSASVSILLYLEFRLMYMVLNRYFPWETRKTARILVELVAVVLIAFVSMMGFSSFFYGLSGKELSRSELLSNGTLAVIVSLLVNAMSEMVTLFRMYQESKLQRERIKRETLESHFETLKNQIGPHFLFNSLNTLISLIDEQPDQAKQFVHKLANYYRHLLVVSSDAVVSLETEMQLVTDYVYLLQHRYGDKLQIDNRIAPKDYRMGVVPLSLQMLVENAEKHNVISAEHPLRIVLKSDGDVISVANRIQPKIAVKGNGMGLENIRCRYALLAHHTVEVRQQHGEFEVRLPLIAQE